MYAGSVGLQLMLINFKPIAAGGMVGASGSIKCQQFIGGAIPPGSRCVPSNRRMYAGSVGLQLC